MLGLAAMPRHAAAWGIDWNDFYVSYRQIWFDKQPGYSKDVNEEAVNVSYANGWTYGSNFVNLDFENFDHTDGANSVVPGAKRADSMEVYGIVRTTLSGDKIFNTKAFTFGPIRDVGLTLGGDFDTQDDQFASYKKLIVVGPQFDINVPKGFWSIAIVATKEYNTNAYLEGTNTQFQWTASVETAWAIPFNLGTVPMQFAGFADFIGPKGSGGGGDFYHRDEILIHPKLLVDVGSLLNYAPNKIFAGVGYEYWHNKFGSVPQYVSGTEQNAVFAEIGYHW
jgi:hypothetical protein